MRFAVCLSLPLSFFSIGKRCLIDSLWHVSDVRYTAVYSVVFIYRMFGFSTQTLKEISIL